MFYVLVKKEGVREKTSPHRWDERSVSPNPRMHVCLAYRCRVCMFRMQVPKNRLPGKDCRFSLNPCGLGYEMICYSYHAPRSCWLHAAVSMRGLHVRILILPECITPRVPKMWPKPNLTLIKQHAPAGDATSLCERDLFSVHELLWHGSCEVCRHYSKGAVTWGHCLISPAVNLIISSHLVSSSLSHCSKTEVAVRPASGPLTRASPSISQNYSAVWFHQMQQHHGWVPSALGGRYVRGLAVCRGTTVGDCPETAVCLHVS